VHYSAFTDASGGMNDSFTMGIAHRDRDGCEVLDLLFERRPPLNPYAVTEEIAALLKSYRCSKIVGDSYGARWVSDAFVKAGIVYRKSTLDRSQIYLNVLPLFMSGCVRLLDHPRLIAQFAALERRTFPTGRDRVDHGRAGHDDAANSAAGALVLASQVARRQVPITQPHIYSKNAGWWTDPNPPAGAQRSPREIAQSSTPAPSGYNRPSYLEPWFPYVTGMGRWPGS
jgi:hypothetical protein